MVKTHFPFFLLKNTFIINEISFNYLEFNELFIYDLFYNTHIYDTHEILINIHLFVKNIIILDT